MVRAMKSRASYLGIVTVLVLVCLAAIVTVNVAVDPWGYYRTPLVAGFNAVKPDLALYEREAEAHRITVLRPGGLVMGASNSDVGLDPGHPGWSSEPAFNVATGQGTIWHAYRMLRHALEFRPPEQVVLGLDLGMFNPALQGDAGISPASFAVTPAGERNREYLWLNHYANALSFRMLRSAIKTVLANRATVVSLDDYRPEITATGMLNPENFRRFAWKTYRNRFQSNVRYAVEKFWAPVDRFTAIEDFSSDPTFDNYRQIVRLACAHDIELYVVLSPGHAYLLVAQEVAGMTPLWERWQQAVVAVTAQETERSGCTSVRLWDFSGYNRYTVEKIADTTAAEDAPRWYWDPAHYRQELGDKVLQTIFSGDDALPAGDFGVLLTPENIAAQQDLMRMRAAEYRLERPAEVALVTQTVREALQKGAN